MSKDNSKVNQFDFNDDENKFSTKQKSWNYPDQFSSYQIQNRTCCSPVDELESLGAGEKYNNTQSVEVQTDRSTLFTLKQEKRLDRGSKKNNASSKECMDRNEFFNFKLRKTGINCGQEKFLPLNINTQVLDEYTETDDQPMNYSLCYDEQNLEEEKKRNSPKGDMQNIIEQEETIEGEKMETIKSKVTNGKELKNKKDVFSSSRSFKEIFNFFKDRDKKRSHESSKSSLSEESKALKTSENYEQTIERSPQTTQLLSEQSEKQLKVKSNSQDIQQTPLIFSRCSSLGSLNGCEQSSVNDDHSSIVSDISHKISDRISSSELPDSPVQLTSSDTRLQHKCQIGCFGKKKIATHHPEKFKAYQQPMVSNDSSYQQTENSLKKLPFAKTSVFEDYLTSFKDESTPTKLHSMAASSLSSLTIDDDDDFELVNKSIMNKDKTNLSEETKIQNDREEPSEKSNNKDDIIKKPEEPKTVIQERENCSREEDDQLMTLTPYEEQLLDECIRRGIAKLTKQNINNIRPFSWDIGLTCLATKALLASRIRIHSVEILSKIIEEQSQQNYLILSDNSQEKNWGDINEDVSLSNPIINDDKSNNNQITENSNYSTYEEQLLDQCIRRGIAKITKRNVNDIRPFSWDTNQICLTTRTIMLHGYNDEIYSGIYAT